jgi:hypothetical protein
VSKKPLAPVLATGQLDASETRDYATALATARGRGPKTNLREALAIAHVESERARETDKDAYFAWNKVIHQLWAIEEAHERGQGI